MLISIIVPFFNARGTLNRAVDSALRQTHRSIEVVCVDDGSTDGGADLLAKYGRRVRLVSRPNAGACAARNAGLHAACGEYVQFLDADDELAEDKLSHQAQLIRDCDGGPPGFVAGASHYIKECGAKTIKPVVEDLWAGLLLSRLGTTSANLFHRADLILVGGWREDLASSQEYDLMFRLLQANPSAVVDHLPKTFVYRQTNSISTRKRAYDDHRFHRAYKLRSDILAHLERVGLHSDLYQHLFEQKTLHILGWLDADYPAQARQLRRQILPRNLRPDSSYFPTRFIGLFRLLGFDGYSRLREALRRARALLAFSN